MTAEAEPRIAGSVQGGRLSDRYVVGPVLGTGATAEVRSGWDCRLERPVAIKLLRPELASDRAIRRRFAEEARAAARLSHPNVVAVFDTGDPDGDGPPYIVMERLPGHTLRTSLESGPLPSPAVRELAAEMLSALQAGASAGLVHCDIKPGNILAASDGRWKLADFGIARSTGGATADATVAIGAGPDDTVTGMVMGTPAYLAPERLCGQAATGSSDVFSLGVVLYEALTGQRPYRTTDSFPWSTALSGRPAPPVRSLRAGVDPGLAAVIDRSVRLEPGVRFAAAEDMAAALRAGASGRHLPRVVASRRARRTLTGALVGAGGLAASLILVTAGSSAPPAPAEPASTPAVQPAATVTPAGAATTLPAAAPTTAPPDTSPVSAVPVVLSPVSVRVGPAGHPAKKAAAPASASHHTRGAGPHHGPSGG